MNQPIYVTRDGKNIIEIYIDHAEIILMDKNNNEVCRAMIDIEDVDKCKQYRWHTAKNHDIRLCRNREIGFLHRFVLDMTDNDTRKVKHIDGDTFNCRKTNLSVIAKDVHEAVLSNPVIIYKSKGYAELILVNNKSNEEVRAKIDLDDVDRIKEIRWTYSTSAIQNNANGCICLHRYIMNASKDVYVKFRNGDKTDCRKANLYIESKYKEPVSKPITKSNTKNPKGVADIGNGRFFVSVRNEKTGAIDDLGAFSNKEEACLAYEKRVREICEELAKDAYESLVASLMEQYYE